MFLVLQETVNSLWACRGLLGPQCHIQGTFGVGIPVWMPKKLSSTLSKSFFFYQTVNNAGHKAGHLRHLPLNQV